MLATSIVLDVILAAVLILFVAIGISRGFIKSIVRLLGFVVAVVVSALVSTPIAQWIYDVFLYTTVQSFVAQKVQEGVTSAAASLSEQITAVIETLPQGIQSLMTMSGVDVGNMSGVAQSHETLVPTVMEGVVTPICVTVLQMIVFLVLFLVLFLIIRLFGKVLDKIFASLPVIKQINGVLGGVLGFAQGVLIVFVLCYGLQLYMTLTGANSLITVDMIEQTHLLNWVMTINPIL